MAQLVKNLPAMWETWIWFLGWEDPLEKGKAAHSSILAWRSPWTLQSMGSQKVGHNWTTFTFRGVIRHLNRSCLSLLPPMCALAGCCCKPFPDHMPHPIMLPATRELGAPLWQDGFFLLWFFPVSLSPLLCDCGPLHTPHHTPLTNFSRPPLSYMHNSLSS